MNDTLYCNTCCNHKSIHDFPNSRKFTKEGKKYLRRICKACKAAKEALRRDQQKGDTERNLRYKRKYGISLQDYNILFERQKQVCAICKAPDFGVDAHGRPANPAIDHCHKTLKVRGLLCRHCNMLIGQARENITILRNAIEYLERHTEE